jgi:hypothetical protein
MKLQGNGSLMFKEPMVSLAKRLHLLPDQGVDESRPSECKGSGRGDDFLVSEL